MPCQSKLISSFSSLYSKKRFAKKNPVFCLVQESFVLKANSTCIGRNSSYLAKLIGKKLIGMLSLGSDGVAVKPQRWGKGGTRSRCLWFADPDHGNPGFDFSLLFLKIWPGFCLRAGMCQNQQPGRAQPEDRRSSFLHRGLETQIFFRVETDVQNTQRGVLEGRCRACFPSVHKSCYTSYKIPPRDQQKLSSSWERFSSKAGWPGHQTSDATEQHLRSEYSAQRYRGDRLALGRINRLLQFCRLESCLKWIHALAAARPVQSSKGADQRQTFLAGNFWYCLVEMDLKLRGKLFFFY